MGMKTWITLATAAGVTAMLMNKRQRQGAAAPAIEGAAVGAPGHGTAMPMGALGNGTAMPTGAPGNGAALPMGAGPGAGYGASRPSGDHAGEPRQTRPV